MTQGPDSDGQRVRDETQTATIDEAYGGKGELLWRFTGDSNSRSFVPFNGGILAEYYCGGMIFDHPDEIGSATTATDCTGNLVNEKLYYPFGEFWTGYAIPNLGMHQEFAQLTDCDPETDQYNTANRHYSPMGRFMSTDPQYVQERMVGDPQSWNLYAYGRNNPLHFVDPDGEAIELDGDDEHRKKELAAIQAAVGAKAGKYLYDNALPDGSHFVGIYTNGPDGKGPDFSTINSASNEISQIIGSKDIAQISVVHAWDWLPGQPPGKDQSLATREALGLTIPGKNVRIYVQDPDDKYTPVEGWKMSDRRPGIRTVGTVTGHELGHAWGFMRGIGNDYQNNKEALDLENKVRTLKNPNAPTRIEH